MFIVYKGRQTEDSDSLLKTIHVTDNKIKSEMGEFDPFKIAHKGSDFTNIP